MRTHPTVLVMMRDRIMMLVCLLLHIPMAGAMPGIAEGRGSRGEIAPTTPAGIPIGEPTGDSYLADTCPAPVPGSSWSSRSWNEDEWNNWKRTGLNVRVA